MVIQFETLESRYRRQAALRARPYVADVKMRYRRWLAGEMPLETLCSDVGDVLENYASETRDTLLVATHTAGRPLPWVLDVYHDAVAKAGAAIRDAIEDSSARHAVAQTLQERVLRAEGRVRPLQVPAEPLSFEA